MRDMRERHAHNQRYCSQHCNLAYACFAHYPDCVFIFGQFVFALSPYSQFKYAADQCCSYEQQRSNWRN